MSNTEAPTSGSTASKLDAALGNLGDLNLGADGEEAGNATGVPNSLGADELAFVNFCHQYYGLHSEILPLSVAVKDYDFEEAEYIEYITNDSVKKALAERGIVVRGYALDGATSPVGKKLVDAKPTRAEKLAHKSLTPHQLLVANAMLDLQDTRSQKKKLQDLNITTAVYNTWLNDPVFSDYCKARAEKMLGDNQHEAHLALLDKIRMGDVKAITLYYEMTGRYVQASAQTSNVQQAMLDFKALMIKVLEIINDEVDDPQIAMRIADRFATVISINNTAEQLMTTTPHDEPLLVPEVTHMRDLNPRLKGILEQTKGS